MLMVPWVIWWNVVDRKRITEIFAFGLLTSLVSSLMNGNGLNLLLWSYPYHLLPFSPRAYSFSLSVLPVAFMIIYQYWTRVRSFALAIGVFLAAVAFIVQPLLSWANIYKLIDWNYLYSFLSLLLVGFASRLVHHTIIKQGFKTAAKNASAAELQSPPTMSPAFKKRDNGR